MGIENVMRGVSDTLSRVGLGVLSGRSGGLHLLCVGELREHAGLKVLPALVLLSAVDEHLVLVDKRGWWQR